MASRAKSNRLPRLSQADLDAAREALGHLNFSSGKREPVFLKHVNRLWSLLPAKDKAVHLRDLLQRELKLLQGTTPAFSDCQQAQAVLSLTLADLLDAYRAHHADLLFHLSPADFEHPFLLGCLFDAVLSQGAPWDERDRIVAGALLQLNDFVGYRPIAVLENERQMELYPHERFRPVPLYIAGAGVAAGRYHDLIARTIEFLREAPADILHESYFDLERLDELAIDVRAHDHLHPVNKRTNYMFGEWDPHLIDVKGSYRRFVVRQIILDALVGWVEDGKGSGSREERLFDAAAALCGTMLMASSISGAGPDTHDSSVTLTSLLPTVARRRDAFYQRLMEQVTGPRARRLRREEHRTQQPFGHVRQYLNMQLAGYGARQVQHRELAHLYARMGYADAARRQAAAIPAPSIRFESEIQCRVAIARQELNRGRLPEATAQIAELDGLLKRGIDCGALVDPWNFLGFQGQFTLFTSREDSIPDNRIETLLELMEAVFGVLSRAVGEAAAQGNGEIRERLSYQFEQLARWWDKFGSDVIEDLPAVSGEDCWEAAMHVSRALTQWRDAGEAAGDITFWRQHVEEFENAQAYAQVVSALLEKGDHVAAMGLLMQWLSQLDEVGFESSEDSIFSLLIRWIKLVVGRTSRSADQVGTTDAGAPSSPPLHAVLRRMFALLEANAEDYWSVPTLDQALGAGSESDDEDERPGRPDADPFDDAEDDDERSLFGAAYDDVVFRDSADDGTWGDTLEDEVGFRNTEFELINREMEPRLKFLNAVGQMWQMAASALATSVVGRTSKSVDPPTPVARTSKSADPTPVARTSKSAEQPNAPDAGGPGTPPYDIDDATIAAVGEWHATLRAWEAALFDLMGVVWQYEVAESSGDHDANVEFDLQLQVKYYLLGQIITTLVCLGNARRLLEGCVPADAALQRGSDDQKPLAGLYVAVIQRNAAAARRLLPAVLKWLEKRPLLYVPFDHGGTPEPILRAQTVQSLIRFLLRELPQMGLLRETWHVLHTAFRMERRWRPEGQAITEFDRLFHLALRSSLETLLASSRKWRSGRFSHDELIDAVSELVEPYQSLWLKHSGTMRLSSVDGLRSDEDWAELADFIHEYGAEFFHPSRLTLGNVRAILHHGVDQYLAFLEENEDPLHPLKLLEDVHGGRLDRADAEWCLETVYSIVVDRFDRFLEYNTTTTQSDYGEMFFCLLEFLRVEARYDRDAWSMVPLTIVHEMLARDGRRDAASVWDATFEVQTTDLADQHLADMDALSQRYGVAMPTIRDHLNQRFVKPLAVNRMVALVAESVQDAKAGRAESESFARLQTEVDQYMVDSWGSGVDVPAWLRTVEHEVEEVTWPDEGGRPGAEAELRLPLVTLTLREFRQQLRDWKEPLEPSPLKGTPRTEQERPASEKRSGNQKQNRRKRRPS